MSRDKQSGGAWPHVARSKNSGSGPTKNGSSLVAYCPHCKQEQDPRFTPHVTVDPGQKLGRCANGHTFNLYW